MIIRPENPRDFETVENLTREAFWNVYRPGCSEHLVLHKLRTDPCFVPELDYVCEEDGRVVANIAYARAPLALDAGGTCSILLFGPVGVLPEYQRRGYGSRLIGFTLDQARKMGEPAVVISGNPAYYRRFGFESASAHGIFYAGLSRAEEAAFFMVKVLDEPAAAALRGTYRDPSVYEVDEAELEAFDKHFPPKQKEIRPGQLH